MLAYKGIVLHCRGAAGPALWLHAEAQMKGWQSCVPRNYHGELAICCLEICHHLHVMKISSTKCQCLVPSHGSRPVKFESCQITCKSSIEHKSGMWPGHLHALVAAYWHCSCKSIYWMCAICSDPQQDTDSRDPSWVRNWMHGSPALS